MPVVEKPLRSLIACCLFGLICLSQAQTNTADTTATFDGRVLDALSGVPVRRANLTLRAIRGPQKPIMTVTSGDGKFFFAGVEPGVYRLFLEKAGYLNQEYGSKKFQYSGESISFKAKDKKSDLEFRAMPQSVLTGRVIDEDGEPVTQTSVIAMQKSPWNRQAGGTNGNTNDIGEFRISGLTPGKYIVVANAFNKRIARFTTALIDGVVRTVGTNGITSSSKEEEDYSPTYFPSSTDEESAGIIEVAAGQQVDNIVIRIRKTHVFNIRGSVKYAGSKTSTEQTAQVQLLPKDSAAMSRGFGVRQLSAMVLKDGSYEFLAVQPGSYYVAVLRQDLSQWPVGRTPLEVNGNMENVNITYGDPGKVSVTAVWEETTQTKPINGYLLLSEKSVGHIATPTLSIKDGKLAAIFVPAGTYSVQFQSTEASSFVKQVREKSGSDLGQIISVTENANLELELVLSTKVASVEGLVTAEGKPAANMSVVLLPNLRGGYSQLRMAKTDEFGHYKLIRVVPGGYRLFAFEEEIPGSAFLNDDRLQSLENKGTTLTVKEGATEQVDLSTTKIE